MPDREPVKVLSIDGGGIRGIIPALVLAEIESRTGRPSCELFDLIAGTSTGGIIALGVTAPAAAEDGTLGASPRWSARQLAGMYEQDGAKVFYRSFVRTIETVDGLLMEKYAATGLEELLESCVGETMLSQALTDVLITSYDIHAHEPVFFKSFHPRVRPAAGAGAQAERQDGASAGADDEASTGAEGGVSTGVKGGMSTGVKSGAAPPMADHPMTVVGRATSAAPTYFAPEDVPATPPGARDQVLVDGGTFANNPAMCAYAEAVRNNPGADVLIVSLGTGRLTESITFRQAKHWGLIQWAHPLLDVIMDGASAAIDYQLDELLGADRGHFRFQARLKDASDSLDDASPANIDGLRRCAERLILSETARIDEVCRLLSAS